MLQDLTDNPTTQRGLYRPIQADKLMGAFGEMLGHALEAENITPDDPNTAIPIGANESRLAFAVRFAGAADRMKVFHTATGGVEEQVAGPGSIAPPGSPAATGQPRPGRGRPRHALRRRGAGFQLAGGVLGEGNTQQSIVPGRLLALVDLFVKADIRFDRLRYATGQRVQVSCQISAGGAPVTGARVEVALAWPGRGWARSSPATEGQAAVRPPGPRSARAQGRHHQHVAQAAGARRSTGRGAAGRVPGPDQRAVGRRPAPRGPANDGTYANTYAGLQHEGSYEWRFTITGITPDGDPFLRVATRSFWAAVGVEPNATKVGVPLVEHPRARRAAEITVLRRTPPVSSSARSAAPRSRYLGRRAVPAVQPGAVGRRRLPAAGQGGAVQRLRRPLYPAAQL